MADTTNYHWQKPTVGASSDDWGAILNDSLDGIDATVHGIDTRLTNLTTSVAALPVFQPGFIIMWSGSAGAVPAGWHLCDGTSGTPDLRDRFVVGAGLSYPPAATGGAVAQTPGISIGSTALNISQIPSHDHAFSQTPHSHADSGHAHTINGGGAIVSYSPGGAFSQAGASFGDALAGATDVAAANLSASNAGISFSAQGGGQPHGHSASSTAIDVRPPFFALCFIMKL